jgi:hypothetical protein
LTSSDENFLYLISCEKDGGMNRVRKNTRPIRREQILFIGMIEILLMERERLIKINRGIP